MEVLQILFFSPPRHFYRSHSISSIFAISISNISVCDWYAAQKLINLTSKWNRYEAQILESNPIKLNQSQHTSNSKNRSNDESKRVRITVGVLNGAVAFVLHHIVFFLMWLRCWCCRCRCCCCSSFVKLTHLSIDSSNINSIGSWSCRNLEAIFTYLGVWISSEICSSTCLLQPMISFERDWERGRERATTTATRIQKPKANCNLHFSLRTEYHFLFVSFFLCFVRIYSFVRFVLCKCSLGLFVRCVRVCACAYFIVLFQSFCYANWIWAVTKMRHGAHIN